MNDDYLSHAEAVVSHNVADAMVNGPGIRPNPTAIIAIDPWKGGVKLTGLGSFGVGSMWVASFEASELVEAILGGAPIESAHSGPFGLYESDKGPAIRALLDEHRPGWREWSYCPGCGRAVTGEAVKVNGSIAHYDCYERIIETPVLRFYGYGG